MTAMTPEELSDGRRMIEEFCERIEQAAREYSQLTGRPMRGSLDIDELIYGDRIRFRWEEWAYSCLTDSGSDEMPAEFLYDPDAYTAAFRDEQAAEERRRRDAERQAKQRREQAERRQLAQLKAKYEPDTEETTD